LLRKQRKTLGGLLYFGSSRAADRQTDTATDTMLTMRVAYSLQRREPTDRQTRPVGQTAAWHKPVMHELHTVICELGIQ